MLTKGYAPDTVAELTQRPFEEVTAPGTSTSDR